MSKLQATKPCDADNLGFATFVTDEFELLLPLGFSADVVDENYVRYQRIDCAIEVSREPYSFEIDVSLAGIGNRFSLSELIRLENAVDGERYRSPTATSSAEAQAAVKFVSELLKRYAVRKLADTKPLFAALNSQRLAWSDEYALQVLYGQIGPRAASAFHSGNYVLAAKLYISISKLLTPSEQRRLEIARIRSGLV